MTKCSKCIDHFREEERRFELIRDLKAKNEGVPHAFLKQWISHLIRELWKGKGFPISVDTEVSVDSIGKVDVVGRIGEAKIAIECGDTKLEKILALKKQFDVVLHIPFCYTWEFVNIDFERIERQMFTGEITKMLEKEVVKVERNKVVCLEEGDCSLPSGRSGYPDEAVKIVGLKDNS